MSALIKDEDRFSLNYEFLANIKSKNTADAYRTDLKSFVSFVREYTPEVKSITQVTPSHIIYYRNFLSEKYSNTTVARKLASLTSYFNFLVRKKIIATNPVSAVERPINEPSLPTEALNEKEVASIFEASEKVNNPLHMLILDIFLTTGMRREELIRIKLQDIKQDGEEDHYIYVIGKRGKVTYKLITKRTKRLINNWIDYLSSKSVKLSKTDYLLLSARKKYQTCVGKSFVYNLVKKYAKLAGINKEISPHSFRATYVTESLKMGIPLEHVQQSVGHSSVVTTLRYNRKVSSLRDSPARKLGYLNRDED